MGMRMVRILNGRRISGESLSGSHQGKKTWPVTLAPAHARPG